MCALFIKGEVQKLEKIFVFYISLTYYLNKKNQTISNDKIKFFKIMFAPSTPKCFNKC